MMLKVNVINRINRTAIYARLSIMDNGRDKYGSPKDSLETQIEYLKNYIKNHPDLNLAGIYSDNGYSGTNFIRPEWERLMEDINSGNINCIIVKDLSRLGRDYIDTGSYLEQIFPVLGVRFISVNDNYDSSSSNFETDSLCIAMKNVLNSYYVKDISKKVSAAAHLKQKKGEYQGAHPPYGYLYSEEGSCKLIPDQITAPVVKQIFEWCAAGYSDSRIVKILDDREILTPNAYFYKKDFIHSEKYEAIRQWQRSTIRRITVNQVYTGCMVRGKSEESLYDGLVRQELPKEKWIIVPDTHEAIISEELFKTVQLLREERKNGSCCISANFERG
jgi:DNA invertase Pin-like site-specific DNA recombinase